MSNDSDGFSQPDPADTIPDPPDAAMDEGDDIIVIGEHVDCENCVHYDVCAYYAGIRPMLEDPQTGSGEAPFDAGELAAICDHFEPQDDA